MSPAQANSAIASAGGGTAARHVAIIMDGNGRWAKQRFLPRVAGHRQGVEAVRRVVRAAGEQGLEALTLYAFSSENWRRPLSEVVDLMGLLRLYLRRDVEGLRRNNVRLRIIGDWRQLDADIVTELDAACALLATNDGLTLSIALNYGGQDEILRAVRVLAAQAKAGEIDPEAIDAASLSARLDTDGLPPLDLMIRTSGETRLSNFMLWQAAYAELMFVDTLWPDFDGEALVTALAAFGRRDRRYGGL